MIGNRHKALILQKRDLNLFRELAIMRVCDREQAKLVAGFRSTTRANTRLLILARAGLLKRFFTGTIAGGRKAVYALSATAAALVDAPRSEFPRRSDETFSADLFLEHQMAINEVFCALKFCPATSPDVRFLRWQSFHEPLSRSVALVPDGYFELDTPTGIRPMFVEVDMGTEALRVWSRKTKLYLHLAISGEFERLFGRARFRTLVVARSPKRLEAIRKTVARMTDKIFRFAIVEGICREKIWSSVWLKPRGIETETLA